MAELPRQSRRLRGQSPEIVTGTDLLRKLRRSRGESPEDVPGQYEGLKVLVTPPSGSRVGSPEEGESSLVVHPDYQSLETGYNPEAVTVSELVGSFSSASDTGEEPEISEPVTPTSSVPDSPRIERIITENLPTGLIAIEELAPEEEIGVSNPEDQLTIDLRECESIFYSPPRSTTWYLSLTNYLDNFGLGFSTPRTPFPPGGIHTPVNMAGPSSVFSQSSESFLHGGPSVPTGYQSLSGTFAGASPQPVDHGLLVGNSGNVPLGVGDIYMMSGSVPVSQPQGGQLPPGGQPQLMSGGQPQGTSFVSGGQPQGQYAPMGQYIPQGQPQPQYVPQGQPQYQYQPQGWQPQGWQPLGYQPQGYQPQGYQPQGQGQLQYLYLPQGQYSGQGYQPPQGQSYGQGMGTTPYNYQSYPQSGYGSQYPQPVTGQYPGMLVWDPSQGQQVLQPSIQLVPQAGQPVVSGPPQQPQPVQSNVQTSITSVVTQPPIAPSTPSQTAAATTATSTILTSGVSTAPVSTVSVTTPQTSLPLSGSTIQTTVHMPAGQPGISTVVTTQPQFVHQPYQE